MNKTRVLNVMAATGCAVSTLAGQGLAQPSHLIDVPAQPLADALVELSEENGINVFASQNVTDGVVTRGAQGPFTPEQALGNLLFGTQLGFVPAGDGFAVISQNAIDQPFDLGTLVVGGELIEREVQDSQTSVVVITGEDLESRSDPNLETVYERTPGINNTSVGTIAIRGVQQQGLAGNGSNGTTVSVTVDGAAVTNFDILSERGINSTWDLEQVEVLRGPQSTQTGRNALAGAVNVRSRDPFFGNEFKLRGDVGTFNTLGGSLAYNVASEENALAFRFSADFQRTDGAIENTITGDDDVGRSETRNYRLGVLWEPTDQFSAILKYTRNEDYIGATTFAESAFPDKRINNSSADNFTEADTDALNLRLAYAVTNQSAVEFESTLMQTDLTQSLGGSAISPVDVGFFVRDREFRSQQYELRYRFESERLSGVVGLFYLDYKLDSASDGVFPASLLIGPAAPPGATVTFVSTTDTTVRNSAVFGEVEYKLRPNLRAIAGLRYDYEKFTGASSSETISSIPIPFPPGTSATLEGSYDAFLPKLGLVYDLDEYRSIGFTIQRGYRAGGALNVPVFGVVAFDPEFTTNYELAYRSQSVDGRMTFNANVFYTRWTDQQVTRGSTPADLRTVNAGESEYYGGEIEFAWSPTVNWDLYAGAAYVQTKFLDFVDGAADFSGNEFPNAPALMASLGATYSFNNGAFVSGDVSYTGSSFANNANTIKLDDRFLVNARIGYQGDNWEAFLYARNLFDESYVTSFAQTPFGNQITAGDPRTVGVILQATF